MSHLKNPEFLKKAQEMAQIGRFFAQNKWSPATSSNYSARLDSLPGIYALTRSGVDKHAIQAEDVILVDEHGTVVEPVDARPSAETLIHCYLYKNPEVGAVLHTHSIFATRLSMKYLSREKIEIKDYELLKGLAGNTTHDMTEIVPILPNAQDMKAFVKIMEPIFSSDMKFHGFLIAGHGLYTWGKDLKEARRHVETYEFLFESMAYSEMGF
ncbi:MAG: methylthioribulose 1-phosphate dehydratase [Bdellovibrionota bacterium]